ncbi:MAG: hypothetical protein AAF441_13070 [Pseudomonadota bacterium]
MADETELPDFGDIQAVRKWFEGQPKETAVVMAVRAALRAAPLLEQSFGGKRTTEETGADIILPLMRGMALPWAAAKIPARGKEFRAAATTTSLASGAANAATAAIATIAAYSATAAYFTAATGTAVDATAASATAAYAADANAAIAIATKATAYAGAVTYSTAREAEYSLRGTSAADVAGLPLWPDSPPWEVMEDWARLKTELMRLGQGWEVWTDWYEARLYGVPINEELETARVLIAEEIWEQGPEVVNAEIQRLIDLHEPKQRIPPPPSPEQLAEMASPQAVASADGRVDAVQNVKFDEPTPSEDLSSLPQRQIRICELLLSDLPGNAPVYFSTSLGIYRDELVAHGVRPTLGILVDQAEILLSAADASDLEGDWLPSGLNVAIGIFRNNHELLRKHFPLDVEREQSYAATQLDEEAASGDALRDPFAEAAEAVQQAHIAGLVTDAFLSAIRTRSESANILSTEPPKPPDLRADPNDRQLDGGQHPSGKKRIILGTIGLLVGAVHLLGSSASISAHPHAQTLLDALSRVIEQLKAFIH